MLISQKENNQAFCAPWWKHIVLLVVVSKEWSDLPFGSRCQFVGISEDRETHQMIIWICNLKSLSEGNSTDPMPRFFNRQIVEKGKNEEKHAI